MSAFVRRRVGDDGWPRLLSSLMASDRAAIDAASAISWLESAAIGRAMIGLEDQLGVSMHDYGRFAAEHDLTVFHRLFLRMANPAFVVEKTGEYWRRFHTRGAFRITRVIGGLHANLDDFYIGPAYCRALEGYIPRLLELVGAADVSASKTGCVSDGARACSYRASYR